MYVAIELGRNDRSGDRRDARGRLGRVVALMTCAILVPLTSWGQGAPATPRQAAGSQTASLARYVPRQDLVFFLEFDGLDAHAKAWHESAAYTLLNDTKLGALVEDLASQGIELAQQSVSPSRRIKGPEGVALLKNLARQGFVLAATGKAPKDTRIIVALRRGDRPEIRRVLAMLASVSPATPAPIRKGGRTFTLLDKDRGWWVEKGDLILSGTDKVDEILAVIDGKRPGAVSHPIRTALTRAEAGFEPVAVGFLDMAAVPLPPRAVKLGLDGLKRIEVRWGFQDNALLSVLRFVAPAPRRGALALLDQPTFGIDTLPPIPSNLSGFAVLSADLVKTYDQIVALTKLASPKGEEQVADFETLARRRLGLDLRGDLFRNIGPRMAFYAQPAAPRAQANANTNPALATLSQLAGLTISVQVREPAAANSALDSMIETINSDLTERRKAAGPNANAPVLRFEKQPGPRSRHEMNLTAGGIRGPVAEMYRPTVVVGDDQLVISATPGAADRALAAGRSDQTWRPSGAFLTMARRLDKNLIFLNVSDPRESMPALIEDLPAALRGINAAIANSRRQSGKAGEAVPLRVDPISVPRADELRRSLFPASASLAVDDGGASLVVREPIPSVSSPGMGAAALALVLPAVQSSREAARRAQCVRNLKQIGEGFQGYYKANKAFPRAATVDRLGKPLLSWRVAILPYIGHQALYNKFKRNETWDTPHNKALLGEMPAIYGCPSRPDAEPFTTNYRVFSGKGAMFETGQDISLYGVTDDPAGTILVAEAKEGVPWTKPGDLRFEPLAAPSFYGAGSSHPGVFEALFADGSVRFIKTVMEPNVFRTLITRHGREKIAGMDAFWGGPQ